MTGILSILHRSSCKLSKLQNISTNVQIQVSERRRLNTNWLFCALLPFNDTLNLLCLDKTEDEVLCVELPWWDGARAFLLSAALFCSFSVQFLIWSESKRHSAQLMYSKTDSTRAWTSKTTLSSQNSKRFWRSGVHDNGFHFILIIIWLYCIFKPFEYSAKSHWY